VKRLLLARHAHAASHASDHERPLSDRGEAVARRLGEFLTRMERPPDRVLASSAERAQRTAGLAAETGGWSCEIVPSRDLYATSPNAVLEAIQEQADTIGTLLFVGHDPTATELVDRFVGGGRFALPAGTLASLSFDASRWGEVDFGDGVLDWLVTPSVLEGLAGAAGSGAGARVEIERKYLLRGVPELGAGADVIEIEQGWLPGDQLRERLRRVGRPDGESYVRTVKLGHGIERIEVEEPASRELFEQLWPLTSGCRIHKQRHRVREGKWLWEIDVFGDRELVLAEVELASAAERPALPDWLAPHVVREVTDDPRFTNLALAESGTIPD
jgi:phosphohistidine phosphatase SixA/CYTH domain-containing protein